MTLCCIAAIYTHFYGLVLSGGCLTAALSSGLAAGVALGPVLMAIAVTGIAAIGLFPVRDRCCGHFRGHSPEESNLYMLAQWIYRLYSHPVLSLGAAGSRYPRPSASHSPSGSSFIPCIRRPFAVETPRPPD